MPNKPEVAGNFVISWSDLHFLCLGSGKDLSTENIDKVLQILNIFLYFSLKLVKKMDLTETFHSWMIDIQFKW